MRALALFSDRKDPAHWTAIIAPTSTSKVESVSCGNLRGTPSLQALVTVRNEGSGAILRSEGSRTLDGYYRANLDFKGRECQLWQPEGYSFVAGAGDGTQ